MSRSRRKFPIIGNSSAVSEKKDKQVCNKRLRKAIKLTLNNYNYDDSVFMIQDEALDKWLMSKDGKHYCKRPDFIDKILRKK